MIVLTNSPHHLKNTAQAEGMTSQERQKWHTHTITYAIRLSALCTSCVTGNRTPLTTGSIERVTGSGGFLLAVTQDMNSIAW